MPASSIRAFRLRAGLSQEELANLAQLSVRTVANIETGRVGRPHSYSLRRLADALNLQGAEREAVLTGPSPPPDGRALPPRQLPTDVGDFTGRSDEVRRISAYLTGERTGSPPIAVISGQAGVGKTTTAVRVAHAVAETFPDGQLFADLGGLRSPQDPAVVLGWFLRAIGVDPAGVPADPGERAALFRSVTAGRRLLIVLDDAAEAGQVRALLPGTGASASIVTSRGRLDALEPGRTFDLPVFSAGESLTMLERVVTARRVAAEPAAALDIVNSCGHLPLAVRIAAARIAALGDMSLATFARGLADEHRRLDQLRLGDLEVRASIELSYAALDEVAKVALRRLSLVKLSSFSAWVMAPLVDGDIADMPAIADRLAEHRLIDVVASDPRGEPRYRVHDLVRLLTLRHLEEDDAEPARLAALQRFLGMWAVVAEAITDALPTTSDVATGGGSSGWTAPALFVDEIGNAYREWFRAERLNLGAAVQAAAAHGLHQQCSRIAGLMASACLLYGEYDLLSPALDVARRACARAGDRKGEAMTLAAMGRLRQELCDAEGAHRLFQEAHGLFATIGDERGQAFTAVFAADSLRAIEQQQGTSTFDQAARWATVAHDLSRGLGDPAREIDAAYVLGKVFAAQGRLEPAADCFRTVLATGEKLNKPIVRCHALFQLGRIARRTRHVDDAVPAYGEALGIAEEQGDRRSVAFIAYELASAEAERGNVAGAIELADRAVDIYRHLHVAERLDQAMSFRATLNGSTP